MSAAIDQFSKEQIKYKMKIVSGPHQGQSFVITKNAITMGRGPENDIILLNDAQISRQHVKLVFKSENNEIEILNLSEKNKIFIGPEAVQKWILINESTFKVGETEIQILLENTNRISVVDKKKNDLLKSISEDQQPNQAHQNKNEPKDFEENAKEKQKLLHKDSSNQQSLLQKKLGGVELQSKHRTPHPSQVRSSSSLPQSPLPSSGGGAHTSPSTLYRDVHQLNTPQQQNSIESNKTNLQSSAEDEKNKKIRLYIILIAVVGGLYFWLNDTPPAKNGPLPKTLKYKEELNYEQYSKKEKELNAKREALLEKRNTATYMRIQENFQKGMRDYQQGNYIRAIDNFQLVLNLDPNHTLARRHIYLSKLRFEEILESKLILGESYYQKHNFKMCQSFFEQVKVMLENKTNDERFKRADFMAKKCRLANEGIH